MKHAVIIMGSESDRSHAQKIEDTLHSLGSSIDVSTYVASAHKTPTKVLEVLQTFSQQKAVVYITIAGRSNALSGFVAGNCNFPVIACPPFSDKLDMLVNIHSSLQMPSQVPVLTILDPQNAALATIRILSMASEEESK